MAIVKSLDSLHNRLKPSLLFHLTNVEQPTVDY